MECAIILAPIFAIAHFQAMLAFPERAIVKEWNLIGLHP
jgi:hypothetical protein